jgi:Fic family protein
MKTINLDFLDNLNDNLARIEEKKAFLDTERPISFGVLEKLKEDLALEWTYNSNSIEGNSLTLAETRVVISDGMTIGGKSIREHFEALNHKKAIEYLETLIKPNYNLRAIDILNIHSLVLKNIDDNYAGRLRDGMVRIIGANFTPPSPNKVSDLLDELIEFVNINHAKYTAPVLATIFHHQFVWIHPFFDGNGRTVRLAMNLLLMKEGYPPAIILKNDRKKYYEALNQANNGKYDKLTLLMLQAIERSLNIYINVLPKNYVEYEPISNIVAEPDIPYGFEYISLLARTGKINAFKEGRNWVTSKKDVMEHFSKRNK